jgi:hypothetical protein
MEDVDLLCGCHCQAGEMRCWTGHSWDHKYFPNPKAFFQWCDRRGLKNSFNLHLASGVQVRHLP